MKRRVFALALAVVLCLGLLPSAQAVGQTFSDVPSSYWGYADIEAAAAAGLMNGTGNGKFSPNLKVSVAQFLTLLGRLVFPETTVGANDTWYGPYVAKAQGAGLLAGTQVNVNDVEAEISRYDMAVILRAAAKKLGVAEKAAQSSEVTDYGMVPTMYADAVLAVYGMGLIKGDQNGNFNGSNTMMRSEVATVIMRLARTKPSGTTDPGATTDPEKPEETEKPTETEQPKKPDDEAQTTEEYLADNQDELVTYTIRGQLNWTQHVVGRPVDAKITNPPHVPVKVYYTKDGGTTSILVYEGTTGSKPWDESTLFEEKEGRFLCSFALPKNAFSGKEKGIYVSAETEVEGQRLVTSDLRTDERAMKDIFRLTPSDRGEFREIELTPPDGEKAKFTVTGYVEAFVNPDGSWSNGYHPEGFTVQLFFKDGTLLGETVTDSKGEFSIDCAIDALDGGFDKFQELYYTKVSGTIGAVRYREAVSYPADGSPFLKSLVDLRVINDIGEKPLRPLRLVVGDAEELDAKQDARNK